MTRVAAVGGRVRDKARGARRRAIGAVLSAPPIRRRLGRRARTAWASADMVAFVCLGNICRSPFAEAFARSEDAGRAFESSGTFPKAGRSSPGTAVAVARRWAIDLDPHRSRVFDPAALPQGAAVFVFDVDNLVRLWRSHPVIRRRLHLLGSLSAEGPLVVPDPYGEGPERFERVYERIAELIRGAAPGSGR